MNRITLDKCKVPYMSLMRSCVVLCFIIQIINSKYPNMPP